MRCADLGNLGHFFFFGANWSGVIFFQGSIGIGLNQHGNMKMVPRLNGKIGRLPVPSWLLKGVNSLLNFGGCTLSPTIMVSWKMAGYLKGNHSIEDTLTHFSWFLGVHVPVPWILWVLGGSSQLGYVVNNQWLGYVGRSG